jgi:magnesium transporter
MEEENKKTPEAEQPHDENEKPIQPEEIDVPIDELTSQDITDASFDAETLLNAIQRHDVAKLNEFFETIPDADIAKACEQLDIKDVITLFRDTKSEQNASLYDELSQDLKESLVQAMTNKELVELINEQYADDVADTVN